MQREMEAEVEQDRQEGREATAKEHGRRQWSRRRRWTWRNNGGHSNRTMDAVFLAGMLCIVAC